MAFKLTLKCIRKTETLEGENSVAEVTLQPENTIASNMMNPNAEANPAPVEPQKFFMNGAMTFTVRDQEEADAYKIGQSYDIAITPSKATPKAEVAK
jgi:hypothetical protein